MAERDKMIDIEKAIADKNPALLNWLPSLLLKYIKRTIHEKELNTFFEKHQGSSMDEFLKYGMEMMGPVVTYEGLENVPETGGIYLTANHPLGGLDGCALIQVCLQKRRDLKFFVNDLLMQVEPLNPLFVPVNKHGRNDKHYKERFENVYNSEDCLLIFPAGLVSRMRKDGTIKDLQWKKSIIQKSKEYQKTIVPVHIKATNSRRFYNLAYWRKKLGIKANLEMFFLADEMYRQKGKRIHIKFGKPIPASQFTDDKKPEEWVQWLKDHVYDMA